MTDLTATEIMWFIAHDGDTIVHHGKLLPGNQVTTGQPFFETFDNEEDWTARKMVLGVQEEESLETIFE